MKIHLTILMLAALGSFAGCNPPEAPDTESKPNQTPRVAETASSESVPATDDSDGSENIDSNTDGGDSKNSASEQAGAGQLKTEGEFKMLSWNVESEGADSKVIADQLAALNPNDHYDIFTLTEVMPEDLKKFRYALGKHYKYVYSKSGRNDRLEILYNEDRFELVRHFELDEINIGNRYRAPLVAHLKERTSGIELMVMVNHLARGKAEIRQQQATLLVEWARNQTLPVFALGDYNFDYVFETRKGNPGFVNMMQDNVWRWIEPTELIDTNWYDNPESPDGEDDYPGSMLDFAFVAGPAKDWKSTCNILVRDGDFPDDEKTSDHRPFELLISR